MSFTDFKEVTSNNAGTTVRYGGNDLKELMQIFNNKTVANRRISIQNPFIFTNYFDLKPPGATPGPPSDTNTSRIYTDPSDNKVKIKKTGGSVVDLENINIPDSALNQITTKSKLMASVVYNDQNNDMGDFFMDFGDINTPANPAAGKRRLFVDQATGKLSVRTNAGTTVDLEAVGGGGGGDVATTQTNTYGDFDQIFRSGRLDVRNPANTFSYSITGGLITATRAVTLPALGADDTFVTQAFAQTLTNKTIDASANTVSNIGDAQHVAHTTSKITTLSKSLLNTAIVYNDQNNDLGAFYVDIAQIAAPANPVAGDRRLFVNTADGRLSVKTPGGGTVALENTIYPDAASGGTVWGLWSGGARDGTGMFGGITLPTNSTATAFYDTTSNKTATNFTTNAAINALAGFSGSAVLTSRNQNFRFKCRFAVDVLTNRRFAIGFAAVTTLPTLTDAYLATAVAGFIFRYSSTTDTTIKLLRNDAAGTAVTVDTGVTLAANTPVTIEIIADEANTRMGWAINEGAFTFYTTDIPANTNALNYFHSIEAKTATASTLRIYYSYLTQAAV